MSAGSLIEPHDVEAFHKYHPVEVYGWECYTCGEEVVDLTSWPQAIRAAGQHERNGGLR